MLTLHLVRHGETNWNAEQRCQGQSDSTLNEQGRQQAATRRPEIEALKPVSVYSSSNVRTLQTTEILNENLALPVTALDGLREVKLGPWEGRLWSEISTDDPHRVATFRQEPAKFQLAGAETFQQLSDRGMQAIDSIIEIESARPGDHNVLVVSHGAILKALILGFAGLEVSKFHDTPALDNCSVSIMRVDGDSREVVTLGGVSFAETAWSV